jgi:hypothetical protein
MYENFYNSISKQYIYIFKEMDTNKDLMCENKIFMWYYIQKKKKKTSLQKRNNLP